MSISRCDALSHGPLSLPGPIQVAGHGPGRAMGSWSSEAHTPVPHDELTALTGEQDAAAVKIQKVHRGKAARTRMNKHSGASGGDFMSNFHRSQRRVKEESAATTIQKHARGRAARGKVKVPGGRGLSRQLQEVKEEEDDDDLMWA